MDSKIFGLVKKDLIVLRKSFLIGIIPILLFIIYSFADDIHLSNINSTKIYLILAALILMIFLYIIYPSFELSLAYSNDAKTDFHKYEGIFPVTRADSVKARYILAALIIVAQAVVFTVIIAVLYLAGIITLPPYSIIVDSVTLSLIIFLICLSIICTSIFLLINYLLPVKSNLGEGIVLAVSAVSGFIVYIIYSVILDFVSRAFNYSNHMIFMILLTIAVSVLIMFISYKISYKVYCGRDL
ncbi:MAG: ABC-2 transporter permease [Methanocorpusculum sp.]|nr:ABC-2 transporter permease [Methanocorpusculum sp.]